MALVCRCCHFPIFFRFVGRGFALFCRLFVLWRLSILNGLDNQCFAWCMEKPGSSYTLHIVVAGNVGLILRWPCFVRFQIAVVWHRVAIPSIGFRGKLWHLSHHVANMWWNWWWNFAFFHENCTAIAFVKLHRQPKHCTIVTLHEHEMAMVNLWALWCPVRQDVVLKMELDQLDPYQTRGLQAAAEKRPGVSKKQQHWLESSKNCPTQDVPGCALTSWKMIVCGATSADFHMMLMNYVLEHLRQKRWISQI